MHKNIYIPNDLSWLAHVQSYFFAWARFLPGEEESACFFHPEEDASWHLLWESADGIYLLGRKPELCSLVGNSPPISCHSLETFINESLESSI